MMSVHDALKAWQNSEITTSRAMSLSGARDIFELYAFAEACDLDVKIEFSDAEKHSAEQVTAAIERAIERVDKPAGPTGAKAA